MNKWILLTGICFLVLVLSWAGPITFKTPSVSNIVVTGFIALLVITGIYLFYKEATKNQKQQLKIAQLKFID